MEEIGYLHGPSTVNMALADMVKQGLLNKDPKARPRGYGLTDRGLAMADRLLASGGLDGPGTDLPGL
jgi:DNA-binding transcriptional regulator PaaX